MLDWLFMESFLPSRLVDWAQIVLSFLAFPTLYFLWKYTRATVALLQATRDQVEVNNRALRLTELQGKRGNLPILVLLAATVDGLDRIVIKNVGTGPALNAETEVENKEVGVSLHHRSVIGAQEEESVQIAVGGKPGQLFFRSTIAALLMNASTTRMRVSLAYEGTTGAKFETWHTLQVNDAGNDLLISFQAFKEFPLS